MGKPPQRPLSLSNAVRREVLRIAAEGGKVAALAVPSTGKNCLLYVVRTMQSCLLPNAPRIFSVAQANRGTGSAQQRGSCPGCLPLAPPDTIVHRRRTGHPSNPLPRQRWLAIPLALLCDLSPALALRLARPCPAPTWCTSLARRRRRVPRHLQLGRWGGRLWRRHRNLCELHLLPGRQRGPPAIDLLGLPAGGRQQRGRRPSVSPLCMRCRLACFGNMALLSGPLSLPCPGLPRLCTPGPHPSAGTQRKGRRGPGCPQLCHAQQAHVMHSRAWQARHTQQAWWAKGASQHSLPHVLHNLPHLRAADALRSAGGHGCVV